MERVDCIIVGAGVVGLAIARELALRGREVIVLEKSKAIGSETSSRSSEVIHAGLYYPPGSLKARLCVEGKRRLYAYCAERGVAAKAVGKLIVATSEDQTSTLSAIASNAGACGVHDLTLWNADEAARLEPQVQCIAALYSPSSGIVDSHALMLSLQGDLESMGGVIAFNSPVLSAHVSAPHFRIQTPDINLEAQTVVNAAGLFATQVALSIEGVDRSRVPRSHFAKGNYFALTGVKPPFTHLIYPVPEQAGLGVHATLDLAGQVRFGPDVEWVPGVDYAVSADRGGHFAKAIRRYWPGLPQGALVPSYSGVRPKIVGPGEPSADFMVQGPDAHGVGQLWNLFGIESPGLTASLALATYVADAVATA